MARIARIDALHLAAPADAGWALSGTEDVLLVRVHDEDGRVGLGECMAAPSVLKAFLEMPSLHGWSRRPAELLVGQDPLEARTLWQRLYEQTQEPGRRGVAVHAISAVDVALWDLAGQVVGAPVWKLLGGARSTMRPYATIFPGLPQGRSLAVLMAETARQMSLAVGLGYAAVKLELLFGELASDRRLPELVREARGLLGPDVGLALDFGYRWRDWQDARRVLDRVADCDILFAEATLQHDDLAGHARLQRACAVPVAGAEFAATRFEALEWIRCGGVSVIQPGVTRAGGFTELLRIADLCELEGVQLIPHGWAAGIGAVAGLHLQAAAPAVPWVEYRDHRLLPSALRERLVRPAETTLVDGVVPLPAAPGLGLTLNEDAVREFAVG
jgi:L-rhamnonate dehydratase